MGFYGHAAEGKAEARAGAQFCFGAFYLDEFFKYLVQIFFWHAYAVVGNRDLVVSGQRLQPKPYMTAAGGVVQGVAYQVVYHPFHKIPVGLHRRSLD